jgi:hypothetical protein
MTLHINDFFKFATLAKPAAGLASLALVAGTSLSVVPSAVAQDASEQDDVEYEWEPGEGKHVEEWYDPSDWFNQDDVTDYEVDTLDYDNYAGTYTTFDYDAYYDGYYDGYFDDAFGYDNWEAAWDPGYSQYYTAGYYDGYYDSQTGYDFDAYYYVLDEDATADTEASDRQRADDPTRERADRQKRSRTDAARDTKRESGMSQQRLEELRTVDQRVRGTVTEITLKGKEEVRDRLHTIGVLSFANGAELEVDFGPYVNANNLSIAPGDVITVAGKRVNRDGESIFKAKRLTHAGVVYRFAGPDRDILKKDMEDGTAKTWGDEDKKPDTKDESGDNSGN